MTIRSKEDVLLKLILIAKLAAFLSLTALCAVVTYEVLVISPKIKETAASIERGSRTAADYIKFQTDIISSPGYQKNLEHASEFGDLAAKGMAKVNRQTIPKFNNVADELTARLRDFGITQIELTRATSNLADFLANTDTSINADLLPAVTKLINRSGATLEEFNAALKIAADGLNLTVEELKRRLADPRIDAMMDEALGILQEGRGTMTEVHKASTAAPGIATSLEKIARESSKFARVTLIANILGTLGRAFLP